MVECQLPKLITRVRFPSLAFFARVFVNMRNFIFSILILWIAGCTTVPRTPTSSPQPMPSQPGIYHKVKKGETIWRIAKAYNLSVDEIISSNNIPNVAKVEESQLIFIPGALTKKDIKLDAVDTNEFIWPVKGRVVQYFHDTKDGEPTNGIRIQVDEGQVVKSSRGGEVVFADRLTGYGETVIIDHRDSYYSVYGENGKLLVQLGDEISQNKDIAYAGKGKNGSYTYFEIRKNAKEENPLYYLP